MTTPNLVGIVADEQDFCRAGLSAMLRRQLNFAAVLEVRNVEQLIDMLEQNPAVSFVTIDLLLPGLEGPKTIGLLRHRFPHVRLIVITASNERQAILSALSAGAHGFIPKNFRSIEILGALRFIVQGHVYVPALLADPDIVRLAEAPEQRLSAQVTKGLTRRQHEVVKLVAEGRSNKEIARMLNIAPGTVKVHVNSAFRSLGVHNRVSAAAAFRLPNNARMEPLLKTA